MLRTAARTARHSSRPLRLWRAWMVPLLLLSGSAITVDAQIVRGRVLDDVTDSGLAAASLTLLDEQGQAKATATSDSAGRFLLRPGAAGRFALRVERQGYRGFIAEAVVVGSEEEIVIELRMATDHVIIAPIAVLGRRRSGAIDDFRARIRLMRLAGIGQILTRGEFEGRDALELTDLMADMPDVVIDGPRRARRILFTTDTARCPPAVFVNAAPLDLPSVDQVATPLRLDAIELYRGSDETPPEFHDPTGCGVVLVWLRPDPTDARPVRWRRAIVYIGMAAIGVVLFSR